MNVPTNSNDSTERAVISCIITEPSLFFTAKSDGLTSKHFGSLANKRIFESIERLASAGAGFDLITIRDDLTSIGQYDFIGGEAYLQSLDIELPDPSNFHSYVSAVRASGLRRATVAAGKRLARIDEGTFNSDQLLSTVSKEVQGIQKLAEGFLRVSSGIEAIDELVVALEEGIELGIASGYHGLDHKISGFRPGNLVVVAGRPGMGKTALILGMIHMQMLVQMKTPLIFSLEMANTELAIRLMSAQSQVPQAKIKTNTLGAEEWQSIAQARTKLSDYDLLIEDSGSLDIDKLAAKARELANTKQVDIIYIDYLQLMSGMKGKSRNEEVGEITRGLKQLARELELPIVAVSQLSRAVESRSDKRPQLSDLRDSGSIEQDADSVIFLYRPGYYQEQRKGVDNSGGVTDLIIAKNRSGPTGSVQVQWVPETSQFKNY